MRRNRKTTLLTLLAFSIPSPMPVQAAHTPSYRVGVSRLASDNGADDAQAYARFERRLAQWLENDRGLGIRVEGLGELDAALGAHRRKIAAIEKDSRDLLVSPDGEAAALSDRLDLAVAEFERFSELAPVFQRVRLAQAQSRFHKGDRASARRFLRLALSLHPEGALANDGRALSKTELRDAQEGMSRGCAVDLDIVPTGAFVDIDGFAFGGRRSFRLLRGRSYQAWVHAEGFGSREVVLDCRRAGQWLETVRLEPGVREPDRLVERLRRLSRQKEVSSLLFLRTVAPGRFGLFLYTPGVGIDPIPLREPLAFGSPAVSGAETPFPIASDALAEILDRHRATPLKVSLAQAGEGGYVFPRQTTASLERPAWYENRVLWIIAGATVAGVTAGLLLNSGKRQVHTNAVSGSVY